MNETIKNSDLRRRAVDILHKRKNKTLPDVHVYNIIEELNLHQIELEIQNENLIKAQLELQFSHRKYSDLYNFAPIAYITLNNSGLIVDINQTGLDMLGMKKCLLVRRCFSRYIAPEDQMRFSQFRQGIIRNKVSQCCEIKLQRWSGPTFDAQIECNILEDSLDCDEQFLICITDITQQKSREQIAHLQRVKIASIDRIRSMNEQIYSFTRNQNHTLTVMTNYIQGCIRRLESDNFSAEELIEKLQKISTHINELANGIAQVRNLSSKSVLRFESADINETINDALSLLNYEVAEFPLTIQYEPIAELPLVKFDKLHIQQVILSLARNAIEAMKDANTTEPKLLIETRLNHDNEIIVSLLDNGPGFDTTIADRLFEPLFTTKSYAMGLGLPTSRTIIEKHGGQLTSHLNPAGGASFQFALPCTPALV